MSYAHSARIVFANMLGTLDHLVGKAEEAGMAHDVLAQKLTEDMFPLELQFRVALNQVLLALNQVAGKTVPLEEVPYQSLGRFANGLPRFARRSIRSTPRNGRNQMLSSI
ncbi:DUF1993 family protein [Sphingomonas sediminicola]|uniref:DUF1993 family protein n=1 Tax=Sphingomonas sediminicola TaxID=386874 RepID=UPI0024840D90|nr:DUF1993 family protein [Sphingomonas sediminicola]